MPAKEGANQIRLDEAVLNFNGLNVTKSRDDLQPKNSYLIEAPTSVTCPAPMTRAALVVLRNAGGLTKDCDYVITDHVQGRLVSGTTIHLQAVNSNTLSENVSVKTTYDNDAWVGIYDIDRSLVLELHDNRGNVARGNNGNEVANFDWGNTAYTHVLVDSSTLTVTYGNTSPVQYSNITGGSTVNLTAFSGTFDRFNVSIVSFVLLNGANGTWRYMEIKDNSTLNATNYTGGGDNYYNTIERTCNLNFSNSTSNIILRSNTLQGANISHASVTSGTFNLSSSTVENSAINHANGAGNFQCTGSNIRLASNIQHILGTMTIANSFIISGATVQQGTNVGATMSINETEITKGSNVTNQSAGNLTMTRSHVLQSSTINRAAGSTGNLIFNNSIADSGVNIVHSATNTSATTISNSHIQQSSTIQNNGGATLTITRLNEYGASNINVANGSGGLLTITDVELFTGTILKSGTSTTGNLNVNRGTVITSDSFVQTLGTGNISAIGCTFHGASGINCTSGNRNYDFIRAMMQGVSRANLSGNGAVTDSFNELSIGDRGTLNVSCSGVANQLNYSTINGLSGSVSLTGTTGGKAMNRIKCNDGSLSINNAPNAATIVLHNISDAGVVTINGHAVGDNLNYFDVSNGSNLTINKTGAGPVQYVKVHNNGTANILGTTTSITKLDVEQGVVVFNGGTCNNLSKKMTGTFTVNGGNQKFVYHWSNTNKTTAVDNNARADYLGLTSTVPIV